MAMFVSKYLNMETELDECGVFDSILDEDSNYFINVKLLKNVLYQSSFTRMKKYKAFLVRLGCY